MAEAQDGKVNTLAQGVKTFEIAPEDFGLFRGVLDHLRGGDAKANARIIRDVLTGERHDEARALVVANAAAALFVGGRAQTLHQAAGLAEQSIDGGAARTKLEQLIKATND